MEEDRGVRKKKMDMIKIKDYCFKRDECRRCPFEAVEGKNDRYCLVGIEPALWDMEAVGKAYKKMEGNYVKQA